MPRSLLLSAAGLGLGYRDVTVVEDVAFDLARGDVLAVVGHNDSELAEAQIAIAVFDNEAEGKIERIVAGPGLVKGREQSEGVLIVVG